MRSITQEEAWEMRSALKTIASYRNEAAAYDGAQAAAKLARDTLERLGLFFQHDVEPAE